MAWSGQAGQDQFVHFMLDGTSSALKYLDVGANHPTVINNTYALEKRGWSGMCVDLVADQFAALYASQRPHTVLVCGDAVTMDWDDVVRRNPWMLETIDYLSFDIDDATLPALTRLPWDRLKFKVLTVEHDGYRLGDGVRQAVRKIISSQGYELLCADVKVDVAGVLCPFEDWWFAPGSVDPNRVATLRSEGMHWRDIVGRF